MRPPSSAEIEPLPPTLRDGEPRSGLESGIVPRPSAEPEPAPPPPAASGVARRSLAARVELLAAAASRAFSRGEVGDAHRAAKRALAVLGTLEDDPALAPAELVVGRCLVGLGAPHQALLVLDAAIRHADACGDPRTQARALEALGHALWSLGDPACREVLEDAGTIFEELGEEAAVRSIDSLLRDVSLLVEESPGSFQAGARRRG
jgi:hypothetical protein